MTLYHELYPVGTRVRVKLRPELEQFRATWQYHHPLQVDQLENAGVEAVVAEVGFYHGGDAIYKLAEIPGLWHEQCLERA